MVWILAAMMAGSVGLALAAPFLRPRRAGPLTAARFDREVYRAQLAEVERDLARGIVSAEDGARLKIDIGRKLLEADRQSHAAAVPVRSGGRGLALLAVATVALGFATYAWLGAPGLRDLPIARRMADAQAMYDARPRQAQAEAAAPKPTPAPSPDPEYAALVQKLRDTLAQRPDDPQGLALLAEHEARLGNLDAALKAQQHLVAVLGSRAGAQDHTRLAALMVSRAGGVVSPEAEAEVARAIAINPNEMQARYLQGLLMVQNGRPDRAFDIWSTLLAADPEAPWAPAIRGVIGDLAWLAGQPDYQPPGAAMPGPDAAAMAAAGQMTDAERGEMVAGMVKRLEDRLAAEGGSPEEWARLIGALSVQGNTAHAKDILAEARRTFAGKPDALAPIEAAAQTAGLE